MFERFQGSKIAVSYRRDGIPSIEELKKMLLRLGKKVSIQEVDYKYVLSTKKDSKETLIIAE
jgi:adenine-specific DNA-methyltransferase